MFILTKIQVRPDTSIPFFHEVGEKSQDFKDYVTATYKDTGKLISSERTLSEDGTSCTTVVTWVSHDAFLEFITDSRCYTEMILPGQRYDIENNITSVSTTEGE